MLEQSIERAFREMADKEQPQSRISVQQALREGRARLRRRRLLRTAGAPLLAASAALAIVLLSVSLPTRGHSPELAQGPRTARARHFSALALYARFGWLPAKEPVAPGEQKNLAQFLTQGTMAATSEKLQSGGWNLSVYAIGACHWTGHQIDCGNALSLSPVPPGTQAHPCALDVREVPAPPVNGHRAFWAEKLTRWALPGRCLTWEYAPGGWASLANYAEINPSKQLVVRVASAVRFGGRQPSLEFPAQFRNLPGKWRVLPPVNFVLTDGALLAGVYSISDGKTTLFVNVGPPARHNDVCLGPGSFACRVINGYRATIFKFPPAGKGGLFELFAGDADHWFVNIGSVTRQHIGVLYTVFSHMKMLGTNPAAWTTKPIS